jgi:protein TonB
MTAIAGERVDLTRWAISAAVVLGLHAVGAAMLLQWHEPIGFGDKSAAIVVDLSPYTTPPSDTKDDIAPGPMQQQAEPAPAPPKIEPQVEPKVEPKVEVPPAPVPPVAALPPPEAVAPPLPPIRPPEPKPHAARPAERAPAPATTAPPREHAASAAEVASWHSRIVAQIERHKAYPEAARPRAEKGVVQIAFSLNRQGHVIANHIARASGYAELDQAALATVARAQPFPTPPVGMPGATFHFTVPIAFSVR